MFLLQLDFFPSLVRCDLSPKLYALGSLIVENLLQKAMQINFSKLLKRELAKKEKTPRIRMNSKILWTKPL